jgi:hypothetical protein
MDFVALSTTLARIIVEAIRLLLVFAATIPSLILVLIAIAAIALILQIPYVGSVAVIPYVYVGRMFGIFGGSKNDTSWSVVYDSKSKLPLDPAYVTVRNMQGIEVANIITDLSGRFALLLPRGLYIIEANKSNYSFPSQKLAGVKTDGAYSNLYFGGTIEIYDAERSIGISIPMDPLTEDWNQAEKKRKNLFYQFDDAKTYFSAAKTYSAIIVVLALLHYGFYVTIPALLQLGLVVIVAVGIFIYANKTRQYAHSFVIDKNTGIPLDFAKVNIFSAATKNKVSQKTTSFEGQFTCLLSKGTYYITVERRDEHGVYTLAYTSEPFAVSDGYMGKRFTV